MRTFTKSDKTDYYQLLKLPIYFVLITYLFIWELENRNFYITSIHLKYIVSALFVYALFVNTERAKIDFSWWIYLSLFAVIGLLGTHASQEYLISSIKISMDFYVYCLGFLIYVIFYRQLASLALPSLLVIVLVYVVYSAPVTLLELISQIPSEDREYWSTGYKLTHSFDFSHYEHLRMFSYHAFIASCCAYILLRHSPDQLWQKLFYVSLLLVCVFGLLLAYGRGSILAFGGFVFVDALLRGGFKIALKETCVVGFLILIFYAVLYYTPLGVVSEYLFSSFFRGAGDSSSEQISTINMVSSGRLSMWTFALQKALESPFYGHGSSSAVWLFNGTVFAYASQPHSVIVQFIMDYGFLGAFVILALAIKLFVPIYKLRALSAENEPLRRSLLSLVFAYVLFALTDGLFYHPYPMLHISIIVAILASVHWSSEEA